MHDDPQVLVLMH